MTIKDFTEIEEVFSKEQIRVLNKPDILNTEEKNDINLKFITKISNPKIVKMGDLFMATNGYVKIPKSVAEKLKQYGCIIKMNDHKKIYTIKSIIDSELLFESEKSLIEYYSKYGVFVIRLSYNPAKSNNMICCTYDKI